MRYQKYVERVSGRTGARKSLLKSFLVGGTICLISQGIFELYAFLLPAYDKAFIGSLMLSTVIVIAVLLTGIGVFDKIGRFSGAGAFLPITGFANSMASSAIEFRSEGFILGSHAKFFSVVGPVLVNGVVFSALAGVLRYLIV